MAFLRDVTDRMWQYISPRKTQQRREKPFKVPTVPVRARPAANSIAKHAPHSTPETKITRWQGELKTPTSASSMDMTLLPPSPPTSVEPFEELDLEGDTLIQDTEEPWPAKEVSPPSSAVDEWDANESTKVVDEARYLDTRRRSDPEKEKLRRDAQGRELRDAGWSEDAVFLFQKLGLRGFEPLLPDSWKDDFDSLPLDMFTVNSDVTFIKPDSDNDFRAKHALEELFKLGGFARDAVMTKAPIRTPEYHIRKAVQKYNRWAMKDADMASTWQDISLFEIVITDKFTRAQVAEKKMIDKLAKLQDLWIEAFETRGTGGETDPDFPEELPTVYGVIASYTIMAFVSYVAPTELDGKPFLRTIAMFDFSQPGFDVWNSLAVSIFIIHCRNRMKQLREFLPEPESMSGRDSDS
ncbi:hypothetical protein P280DRAFT_465381 [Massarina eburnea CBS 473.64]|uniref:Uncharacterized protein n=1 Tax=Massarina eburnea CBS 473.64 TaxID=1395130 RepID=A0A6A6SCJ0_9PLEO|nr:hypothetical protein P280DRAFT_465381 [Massarina eburnea CBS 473.64]